MAKALKFIRFTNARHLKHLSRAVLGQLLAPHLEEMKTRGVTVPADDLEDKDYYARWSDIFAEAEKLPDALTEALLVIDDMSTETAHESLLVQMELASIVVDVGEDATAMEVAVQVFLHHESFLKARHAEEQLHNLRSFVHFLPEPGAAKGVFQMPTAILTGAFADALKPFFRRRVKGRYVDVLYHAMDGEHWFVIVHGDTVARTLQIADEQKPTVLRYRPERDDVLVYNPGSDTVRVNAANDGERKEYAKQFGGVFLNDEGYFTLRDKYRFDPVKGGRAAFAKVKVEGIREVVLRELRVFRGWDQKAVVTLRANDVFKVIEENHFHVGPGTIILKVGIDFYFGDDETPRFAKIVDENTASIARACNHALIEQWFDLAGFIVGSEHGDGQ